MINSESELKLSNNIKRSYLEVNLVPKVIFVDSPIESILLSTTILPNEEFAAVALTNNSLVVNSLTEDGIFSSKRGEQWRALTIQSCPNWSGNPNGDNYLYTIIDTIIIVTRPFILELKNEQNLYHNSNGPAIKWRDKFGIYFWNGIPIPKNWIENKESIKPETALNWSNIEQRRCLCEILGWDKILSSIDYLTIDKDPDPEIGELLMAIINFREEKFVKVKCGTGRIFVIPVPPFIETALQAQAWMWGYNSETIFLKPEVRS